MIKAKIIIVGILVMLSNCKTNKMEDSKGKETNPIEEITWLKELIAGFEKDNMHKQLIEQYTYNGKEVFMIHDCYQCPDALTYVYDKEKNVLCEFGGFVGKNTCLDFIEKAVNKKTLYQNIKKENE